MVQKSCIMKKSRWFGLIVLFSLLINACATPREPGLAQGPIIAPASETPLPTPAASETPTQIPTIAPSATPIPHPLQIEAMRSRDYPGSDIVIEETLDPGVNYNRYYVSYLSEGLKIYALMTVPNGEKPATGWPVIIFNHGYIPPAVYRTTERYVAYVDLIARSGYIVFRSDYRGHDRSEGCWTRRRSPRLSFSPRGTPMPPRCSFRRSTPRRLRASGTVPRPIRWSSIARSGRRTHGEPSWRSNRTLPRQSRRRRHWSPRRRPPPRRIGFWGWRSGRAGGMTKPRRASGWPPP